MGGVDLVLTISKLKRWSINYYIDTAQAAESASRDVARAGGGLGEYYCCIFEIRGTWEMPRCVAHNPEVAGSNPIPATKKKRPPEITPGAVLTLGTERRCERCLPRSPAHPTLSRSGQTHLVVG